MALIGVIPAAGFGTRLGLTGVSKEMVVINGRPVIDFLVERMEAANPDAIRVITREAKIDVIENAAMRGLDVIRAETRSAAHSIALGVADLDPDDIVMIGFPDTIWSPIDGFLVLVAHVSAGSEIALGLFESEDPERSDVVILDDLDRVTRVLVKPPVAPSNQIWGCAAVRSRALDGIERFDQPGDHFDRICAGVNIAGVRLSSDFVDIGTTEQLHRFIDRQPPDPDL